jgi:hypothetical protein
MAMPENFERFGRKVDEGLKDVMPKVESELKRVIGYINDEVVPEVRREGSDALRAAADQLKKLADYMDQKRTTAGQ